MARRAGEQPPAFTRGRRASIWHVHRPAVARGRPSRREPYARETVSEWAARYAQRRDRGEDGRAARWRILQIGAAGSLAFATLEVVSRGARYIDHLALLRTTAGWRIAAAVWGDPRDRAERR